MSQVSVSSSNAVTPAQVSRNTSPVISLQDIRRVYDLGEVQVQALKGVSLEIPQGQFVALMGTSGSGKSTMLNILGCLDRPTSGVYRLDGVDVSTFSPAQRGIDRADQVKGGFGSLLDRAVAVSAGQPEQECGEV